MANTRSAWVLRAAICLICLALPLSTSADVRPSAGIGLDVRRHALEEGASTLPSSGSFVGAAWANEDAGHAMQTVHAQPSSKANANATGDPTEVVHDSTQHPSMQPGQAQATAAVRPAVRSAWSRAAAAAAAAAGHGFIRSSGRAVRLVTHGNGPIEQAAAAGKPPGSRKSLEQAAPSLLQQQAPEQAPEQQQQQQQQQLFPQLLEPGGQGNGRRGRALSGDPESGGDAGHPHFHFHRYDKKDMGVVGQPLRGSGAASYHRGMMNLSGAFAYPFEDLVSLPECAQLTFDSSLQGKLYQDRRTRHIKFEPDACRLRRFSADAAHQCLKGQRLVFLGDSVTRYQYTSFVNYLASGYYQNPYDDGKKSVSNVDHWDHSYDQLYAGVTDNVRKHLGERGSMVCDCDKSRSFEEWAFTMDPVPLAVDYKYVYRYPTWAEAGINALDWAVDHSVNLAQDAPAEVKRTGPRQVFQRPFPATVVFNMCAWWGTSKRDELERHMRKIFRHGRDLLTRYNDGAAGSGAPGRSAAAAAAAFVQSQPPLTLVWKSCTVNKEFWEDLAPLLDDMARVHGWRVLNVRELVHAANRQNMVITWHNNTVHFLQLAYETMNDMLLNIMCPPPKKESTMTHPVMTADSLLA